MRISLQIATGFAVTAAFLAVVLHRSILAFVAIGWAYLATSHSFLTWIGTIGAILLLIGAAGILFKFARR